jgi:hypothetical protein
MTVSKSRSSSNPVASAGEDDNEVAPGVRNDLQPTFDISPQAKSKGSKSSFTVFGLQPSPELLSISMGENALT